MYLKDVDKQQLTINSLKRWFYFNLMEMEYDSLTDAITFFDIFKQERC